MLLLFYRGVSRYLNFVLFSFFLSCRVDELSNFQQVFYGVWSDNVPLLGSRRRSYVILCLLLSCLLTWTNAAFVNSVWMMFATAIPYNVAFSFRCFPVLSDLWLDNISWNGTEKRGEFNLNLWKSCKCCTLQTKESII